MKLKKAIIATIIVSRLRCWFCRRLMRTHIRLLLETGFDWFQDSLLESSAPEFPSQLDSRIESLVRDLEIESVQAAVLQLGSDGILGCRLCLNGSRCRLGLR